MSTNIFYPNGRQKLFDLDGLEFGVWISMDSERNDLEERLEVGGREGGRREVRCPSRDVSGVPRGYLPVERL
jgi:hypothetical protein